MGEKVVLRCGDCQAHQGTPISAFPHERMEWLGNSSMAGDHVKETQHYRCAVCSTRWVRDMDNRTTTGKWQPMGGTIFASTMSDRV